MVLLCLIIAIVIIFVLTAKIYLLKRSAREITHQLDEKLSEDTNTLIDISSGDRDMRRLADNLNGQLKILRAEHIRFQQGDTELKNAIMNVSHDLRTPITAIDSYLDLLEKNPEKLQYIKIIRERTENLSQLTEELFRYSVITSPEYTDIAETLTVNSVLEECILTYYATLQEHGIVPEIDITDKQVIRNVSRNALNRVFANLLNNAVKYSDGDLRISMNADGVIIFANKSAELSEVQTERLFDRFYTIENARKSTGLGLSIARVLIEEMNGSISAEYCDDTLFIKIELREQPSTA